MNEITKRYRGAKTPKGHELRVNERGNELFVWFLFWGEHLGRDAHHHFGIARVRQLGSEFELGRFRGIEQEPFRREKVPSLVELLDRIDAEIAVR